MKIWLKNHALLLVAGISCEILYLFYYVREFPLLRYYRELVDIGKISRHSPQGFLTFALAITFTFVFFGLAITWTSRNTDSKSTIWLIFGFGALFAETMVWVYPGTAIDVFSYISQSLIMLEHHANPLVTTAWSLRNSDPMVEELAGGLAGGAAPYGPVSIWFDSFSTMIASRNVLANLLVMKGIFSLLFLAEAYIVYDTLKKYAPRFAVVGALFIMWNPCLLFEISANGHNDVILMFFVVLAVRALVNEQPIQAFVCLLLSILTKYVTVLLLPLFLLHIVYHYKGNRLIYLLKIVAASSFVLCAIFAPFWSGDQTFKSLLDEELQWNVASFSSLLFTATHIELEQGKLIGRIIFIIFYLYTLFLSTKDTPALMRGCFFALFFFLAVGTPKVMPWYGTWPIIMAAMTARPVILKTAFLFSCGAMLSNCINEFIVVMVNPIAVGDPFMFCNGIEYLIVFIPALCMFACSTLLHMSGEGNLIFTQKKWLPSWKPL